MLSPDELEALNNQTAEQTTELINKYPVVTSRPQASVLGQALNLAPGLGQGIELAPEPEHEK